ncbi:MAG: hypothetical protein ACE5G0_06165 [Rhodothermales bacterium]
MTDQQDPRREQYDRAREAFEDLKIEDRTLFLLKETINTIAQGVDQAVKTLADGVGGLFHEEEASDNGEAEEPKAKSTRSRASTRKKATGTSSKSTTTRKTTTKKTSTAKKSRPKSDDA